MNPAPIALSSDTESRPTPDMREAIARAEVGDEQHGNDPTVNVLQERVAALLGKEAALWFPGGTMCNFVATRVHTQPADAVIADWMAHIIRAESAGVAMSSGVLIEPIKSERGIFSADDLEAALNRLATVPLPYGQPCGMISIEQTHNLSGGSVWSLDEVRAVSAIARARGIPLHIDGARLMNASVASGVAPEQFAAEADSIWLDFTKGLGAPIGAVLAGSQAFVDAARRMKHVFGGAMRQAGIAAAGCIHALDHHVERLSEDHQNARALASGLTAIEGIAVHTPLPESNMVFFSIASDVLSTGAFLSAMADRGVKLGAVGGRIRAVTHLDVSAEDITTTLNAVAHVMRDNHRP